jgi:hypothetical protein
VKVDTNLDSRLAKVNKKIGADAENKQVFIMVGTAVKE